MNTLKYTELHMQDRLLGVPGNRVLSKVFNNLDGKESSLQAGRPSN
jgi:hypothetical protein